LTTSARSFAQTVSDLSPPNSDVVLVIDQLEELYTLGDPATTHQFVQAIGATVADELSRFKVIVTLRADYYDRPLHAPDFADLIVEHQVAITPLSARAIVQVINGPANRVGVTVDSGVLAAISRDMSSEPLALPQLQFVLTTLFQNRSANTMTLAGYERLGGFAGALSGRADRLYNELDRGGRDSAKRVFLELVAFDGGATDTRRRAPIASLGPPASIGAVLERFGKARLLTFDRDPESREPTVEVAHEALLREWPRLREWIETSRDEVRTRRAISDAAAEWARLGRDPSLLLRGARLAAAADLSDTHVLPETGPTHEFVNSSKDAATALRQQEQRVARRLRRLSKAIGTVAVVALAAGGVAVVQARRARTEARAAAAAQSAAETRRLAADATSLASTNRPLAMLLAVEAYNRNPSPTTLGAVQATLVASQGFLGLVASGYDVTDMVWLDQSRLAVAHSAGLIIVDIATGEEVASASLSSPSAVIKGPNNTLLAASGENVVRFDAADLSVIGEPIIHDSRVTALAAAPDGTIATGTHQGIVRLFNADGSYRQSLVAHPERAIEELDLVGASDGLPHQPESFSIGVSALSFSPDSSQLVSAGLAVVRIWDTNSGSKTSDTVLVRSSGEQRAASSITNFSGTDEKGTWVGTSFEALLIDSSGQITERILIPGLESSVLPSVISNTTVVNDRSVFTARDGGTVVQFSNQDGHLEHLLDSQLPGTAVVSLDPDQEILAVGGGTGVALLSLAGRSPISRTVETELSAEVTINSTGDLAVISNADSKPPQIYDLSGATPRRLPLPELDKPSFGFLNDDNLLAISSFAGHVVVMDEALGNRSIDALAAFEVIRSHNGEMLAIQTRSLADQLTITVYDYYSGQPIAELDLLDAVAATDAIGRSLVFSPDDRWLAAATSGGAAVIWDTGTWELQTPLLSAGGGKVMQLRYSHDSKWLATVDSTGAILLRDAETLQPVGAPFLGNTDAVGGYSRGPYFTVDGQYLVTAADGQGRIWDIETRQLIGAPYPNAPNTSANASPNANYLATVWDGHAVFWDLDLESYPQIACQTAGRNLTADEWHQFGPRDTEYHSTCDQWPAPFDAADQPPKQ